MYNVLKLLSPRSLGAAAKIRAQRFVQALPAVRQFPCCMRRRFLPEFLPHGLGKSLLNQPVFAVDVRNHFRAFPSLTGLARLIAM